MITKAFCKEIGEHINIENYDSKKHKTIVCNNLHPLIAKQGDILKHHFAHTANTECKYKNKSPFHLIWQSLFEQTEIFYPPILGSDFRNGGNFADIVVGDLVIEIQHSSIKKKEIDDREIIYDNMIWIFDVRNSVTGTEFICKDEMGKCLLKLNKKYLFETSKPTYYDCGKYLCKRISLHNKYALCEIVEYSDFFKGLNVFGQVEKLISDPDFDFSFSVSQLEYKCGKIFFECESDINFSPFSLSKYVENRYFLPF